MMIAGLFCRVLQGFALLFQPKTYDISGVAAEICKLYPYKTGRAVFLGHSSQAELLFVSRFPPFPAPDAIVWLKFYK